MQYEQIDLFEYLEEIEFSEDQDSLETDVSFPSPWTTGIQDFMDRARTFGKRQLLAIRTAAAWFIKAAPLLFMFQYVNVYTVKRVFKEEVVGNYDLYQCCESVLTSRWNAEAISLHLKRQYQISHCWGSLGKDHWAQEIAVLAEARRMYGQTIRKSA